MKLFIGSAALAAIAVTTSAASLRSVANKYIYGQDDTNVPKMEARVIVHGLKDDLNKGDMAIIKESVIKAYNDAYATSGHSIESFISKNVINFEGQFGADGAYCRYVSLIVSMYSKSFDHCNSSFLSLKNSAMTT